MKKYEMLEKAMRDYPAGTVARFKSAPHVDHVSNGVFRFDDFNQDGKLHIVCGRGINCVYSDGEWAEPVKDRTFVLKSEDGVDLYDGDGFYSALMSTYRKVWMLGKRNVSGDCHVFNLNAKESAVVVQPEKYKAFSTKEAAEKWIEEQNKPKEIIVSPNSTYPIYVSEKGGRIVCEGTETHDTNLLLSAKEIEAIYAAYKSLQS